MAKKTARLTGDGHSGMALAAPGFLAPLALGGFGIGLKTGLHWFEPGAAQFWPVAP